MQIFRRSWLVCRFWKSLQIEFGQNKQFPLSILDLQKSAPWCSLSENVFYNNCLFWVTLSLTAQGSQTFDGEYFELLQKYVFFPTDQFMTLTLFRSVRRLLAFWNKKVSKKQTWGKGAQGNFPVPWWASPLLLLNWWFSIISVCKVS